MSRHFEELDYRPTLIGALSLCRRRELSLGVDVFEIKLGEDYLMSSLFTASEIALARLGLDELAGRNLDAGVGGRVPRCRHRLAPERIGAARRRARRRWSLPLRSWRLLCASGIRRGLRPGRA